MPDSHYDFATASTAELQLFVATLHDELLTMVGYACRKYKYAATTDTIPELTEEVKFLLLENDCHRLRTYSATKSKFSTWLNKVVEHHVIHYFQRLHPTESLEDILLNTLGYAPTQEQELLRKEQLALMYEEIEKLSQHNQVIAYLKLREVPSEEIAQHLNIKAASVEREWRVIKTTLVCHLAVEWQSKAKQSKVMIRLKKLCKSFLDSTSAFCSQVSTKKSQFIS